MRGHHVYGRVWRAVVGEQLTCEPEHGNKEDPYTVGDCSSVYLKIRTCTFAHLGKIWRFLIWQIFFLANSPNLISRQIFLLYSIQNCLFIQNDYYIRIANTFESLFGITIVLNVFKVTIALQSLFRSTVASQSLVRIIVSSQSLFGSSVQNNCCIAITMAVC